ncbi:MAG: histone H1 [Bacteroidales bacterium]|nr:histone H1 [Candidatus Cryptobacteroides faecihippi]MCQ2163231.1 histone H1 [Bacteroidales bacterium]
METLVAKIKEELNEFVTNAEAQVVKGNKAAGARARKAALELMKDLKEFRKESVAEAKK